MSTFLSCLLIQKQMLGKVYIINIIHTLSALMTNLNWASLNLPTPLLHSEIVSSTLSASFQHPLTPKHANTPNWAVGRWQMLAVWERGWVSFWMNVKALVKRRAWALHYPPRRQVLNCLLKSTNAERNSPTIPWVLSDWEAYIKEDSGQQIHLLTLKYQWEILEEAAGLYICTNLNRF